MEDEGKWAKVSHMSLQVTGVGKGSDGGEGAAAATTSQKILLVHFLHHG